MRWTRLGSSQIEDEIEPERLKLTRLIEDTEEDEDVQVIPLQLHSLVECLDQLERRFKGSLTESLNLRRISPSSIAQLRTNNDNEKYREMEDLQIVAIGEGQTSSGFLVKETATKSQYQQNVYTIHCTVIFHKSKVKIMLHPC